MFSIHLYADNCNNNIYMGLLMQQALHEVMYHTDTDSFNPQVWPGSHTETPVLCFQVLIGYMYKASHAPAPGPRPLASSISQNGLRS